MLTAPAAAARSPALSTWLSCSKIATRPGSMPRHSHMPAGLSSSKTQPSCLCYLSQEAEVSCCGSWRSVGLGLHLRGSELPAT